MLLTAATSVFTRSWYLNGPDADSGVVSQDETAGPIDAAPPERDHPWLPSRLATALNLAVWQGDMFFAEARHREVQRYHIVGRGDTSVVVSNPAHIRSVMAADPTDVQTASNVSPLRPIIGPNSVITAVGERHRQQRGLLMPHFHGKAIARYVSAIEQATTFHIDRWPVGRTIQMAELGQSITLDVIMSAVFGIGEDHTATHAEADLREKVVSFLRLSTLHAAQFAQIANAGSADAVGITKLVLKPVDSAIFRVIAERRRQGIESSDILSVLLAAKTESGGSLTDQEIRDELMTLVLAGHETTSNTLAWTFERLTRHPEEYHRVQDAVRAGGGADQLEAVIYESMRSRPVVPIVGRQVLRPWQFGAERVATGSVALISVLLLHHRDELYPKPFAFRPDRFLGTRMPPHTFIPFGGGNRRCLDAALAMAELQTVTRAIFDRVDLRTHHDAAEKPRHRNVTMIPADGGLVKAVKKV